MSEDPTDAALADRFRARLCAEALTLAEASRATAADRRPVALDQSSVGRLSRMDALQNQAMAASAESRRRARGRAVAAAIARLDAGEFGYCEACGAFIGWARLDLDPAVRSCVGCAR